MTYLALAWLAGLMLAANAGASIPDGLGLTVFFVTLWSSGFCILGLVAAGRPSVGSDLAFSSVYLAAAITATRRPLSSANTNSDCIDRDNCDGDA
jgi:hypothetical protein